MCGNPFQLNQVVNGDFKVESINTIIIYRDIVDEYKKFPNNNLNWHFDGEFEYLTLNEILEQVMEFQDNIPYLRVEYETGLWGVIFEYVKCLEKKWVVYGITKGFA